MKLPHKNDFPPRTRFYIKESDVPLAQVPNENICTWFNWYGGKPKEYDVKYLKLGNNWEAESFETWVKLIENSI